MFVPPAAADSSNQSSDGKKKKQPRVERIKEYDVRLVRVLCFDRSPQSFGYLEVKSHLLNG